MRDDIDLCPDICLTWDTVASATSFKVPASARRLAGSTQGDFEVGDLYNPISDQHLLEPSVKTVFCKPNGMVDLIKFINSSAYTSGVDAGPGSSFTLSRVTWKGPCDLLEINLEAGDFYYFLSSDLKGQLTANPEICTIQFLINIF